MQNKLKITLFITLFAIMLIPFRVDAAAASRIKDPKTDKIVCVNGRMWQITNAGRDVQLSHITQTDLNHNCMYNSETGSCKAGSTRFTKQDLMLSCAVTEGAVGSDSYKFSSCPLEADEESVTNVREISNKYFTQEWDTNRNQWKVTITHANNYSVGKVTPQSTEGGLPAFREACLTEQKGECVTYGFPVADNAWLSGNNGTFVTYYNPGEDYALAFYLDSGNGCDGAYMGYIQGSAPSAIPNPLLSNPTCTAYRDRVEGTTKEGVARSMVNECFDSELEYSLIQDYRNKLNSDIARADNILNSLDKGTVNDSLQCYFDNSRNSNDAVQSASSQEYTQFLEGVGGEYWGALCTEKLTITYEQPKGLAAGQGFSYTPVINMTRTCTPVEIKRPKWRPQCDYGIECYGGPANHNGEGGAGPNNDFDTCVNSCDGGAYTQECVNQCYKEIYPTKSASDQVLSKSNLIEDGAFVKKVATNSYVKCNPERTPRGSLLSSCRVIDSNHNCGGDGETYCYSEHGIKFTYLNGCNANGTVGGTLCYEVFKSTSDCVLPPDDPWSAYSREVAQSEAEYRAVQAAIQQYTSESLSDETFSASVLDSHTGDVINYKDATDKEVQVEVQNYTNQTADGKLVSRDYTVERVVPTSGEDPTAIIGDNNLCAGHRTDCQKQVTLTTYKTTRKLTLNLDEAYLSMKDVGDIKYGKHNFEGNPDLLKYYYNGGNMFYTNINAKGVNLLERWPIIIGWDAENVIQDGNFESQGIKQNIYYHFSKLGSWQQWSSIDLDCFYGIKSNTSVYCDPAQGCEPCATGEPNCINSPGIIYIFRPIDLNQPFLEDQAETGRDPRWNWTTNATNLKYNIEPDETRLEIINKGFSIYDTSNQEYDSSPELDYEIKLTKQNINAIRQYNYEHNYEYLDYDMYCYTDANLGINVCRSDFLSGGTNNSGVNTNQYLDLVHRGLIGCNNETGGQCTRRYVDMTGGSTK